MASSERIFMILDEKLKLITRKAQYHCKLHGKIEFKMFGLHEDENCKKM